MCVHVCAFLKISEILYALLYLYKCYFTHPYFIHDLIEGYLLHCEIVFFKIIEFKSLAIEKMEIFPLIASNNFMYTKH